MKLSYFSKYEKEIKTLKLTLDPLYYGIGHYKDIDGNLWDIHCVIGMGDRPYICARPVDHNSPYYSTASWGHSYGFHSWIPYYFEVISNKNGGKVDEN
jgi:hypothetical protein